MSAAESIFERELLNLRLSGALLGAFNGWKGQAIRYVLDGRTGRFDVFDLDRVFATLPDTARPLAQDLFDHSPVFADILDSLRDVNGYARGAGLSQEATVELMRGVLGLDTGVTVPVPTQALRSAQNALQPVLTPAGGLPHLPEHPMMVGDLPFATVGHTYRTRLEETARTLATSVSGYLARQEAEATGQDLRWVTMGDHRVRSSHRAAQGQTVAHDEWFTVGGIPMEYPGDPAAPDDETINCRCTLTLVKAAERRYVQAVTSRDVALAAAAKTVAPEDQPEPLFDLDEGEGAHQRWETFAERGKRLADEAEARGTNPSLTAAAPNQARAPKGVPIGGQWIDTPGGMLSALGGGTGGDQMSVDIGGATYTGTAADPTGREDDIRAHGGTTPTLYRSEGDPESAQAFQNAIQAAKDGNKFGASVYVYPLDDYKGMTLWLTADGTAGVALHGTDIVSVFNAGSNPDNKGFVQHAMATAQAAGGTHADAFDTVLPKLYAEAGMQVVARVKWDDNYAPDDWDYNTFAKFNGGRPDVVFLRYDPATWWGSYTPGQGKTVADYEEGVALTASGQPPRRNMPDGPGGANSEAVLSAVEERTWTSVRAPSRGAPSPNVPAGGAGCTTTDGRSTATRTSLGSTETPTPPSTNESRGSEDEPPNTPASTVANRPLSGRGTEPDLTERVNAATAPASRGDSTSPTTVPDADRATRSWTAEGASPTTPAGTRDRLRTPPHEGSVGTARTPHVVDDGRPESASGVQAHVDRVVVPLGGARVGDRLRGGVDLVRAQAARDEVLAILLGPVHLATVHREPGGNPSSEFAAPNQARAPKGVPIGGQWIDTPNALLHTLGWGGEEADTPTQAYTVPATNPPDWSPRTYDKAMADKFHPEYTPEQAWAIQQYTGQAYVPINAVNRGQPIPEAYRKTLEDPQKVIDLVDSSFAPIPGDARVYRGVGSMLNTDNPDGLVGSVLSDKTWLSSTVDPFATQPFTGWGKGKGILQIDVPKGTPIVWPGEHAAVSGEGEMILPKNTPIAITGWHEDPQFGVVYEATVATPSN